MRFGAVFPHGDEGLDAGASGARRFVQAVEAAGYDYLAVADHVLGAEAASRPGWEGPYTSDYPIRETLVHLGFLAGLASLELVTSVLVLPQRQTALVAKQAAEIDQLTDGNLRLGVGVGWNEVEFQALGVDFHSRGDLFEEQLQLLRLLWASQVVTFEGRFHTVDRAGICPLPTRGGIPVWIGGGPGRRAGRSSERVFDRIARLGDGWISGPNLPTDKLRPCYQRILELAEKHGREPGAVGLQSSLKISPLATGRASIEQGLAPLIDAGATHVTVETRRHGLTLEQNIDLIGTIGELVAELR